MNLPPRQQQILELVRERGYVSIEEMAQLFVVTPQTIRRDINQLAKPTCCAATTVAPPMTPV